jgi:hypothetical protein
MATKVDIATADVNDNLTRATVEMNRDGGI